MKREIPLWALRRAQPEEYGLALDAYRQAAMQIKWPNLKTLRAWAKDQAWPTPWFGFEQAFLAKLLESESTFALAINKSGIELQIPKPVYTISLERLAELDALYDERSPSGQPVGWGSLVEELREIRRAVEAGVVVKVEGAQEMRTWQGFYEWAHGRFYMLEEGYDHWIGDDNS